MQSTILSFTIIYEKNRLKQGSRVHRQYTINLAFTYFSRAMLAVLHLAWRREGQILYLSFDNIGNSTQCK